MRRRWWTAGACGAGRRWLWRRSGGGGEGVRRGGPPHALSVAHEAEAAEVAEALDVVVLATCCETAASAPCVCVC
eukprot:6591399-Prymnesium_polylepis.1